MKFSLVCPHCRHQNVVGPQDCGKAMQCPQCRKVFYCAALPATPAPTPSTPSNSASSAWVRDLTGSILSSAEASTPSPAAIQAGPSPAAGGKVILKAELIDDVPMAEVVGGPSAAKASTRQPVAANPPASRKALYASLSVGGGILVLVILQIIVLARSSRTSGMIELDANGKFRHDGILFGQGPNPVESQFKVKLERGKRYVVQNKSRDFDAFLVILDDAGGPLAHNDDFQGLDSRIDFIPPKTGPYTIVARALDHRSGGRFTLLVDEDRAFAPQAKVEEEKLPPPPPPRPIELSQGLFRIDGELTENDPLQGRGGRRFRAFLIRLKEANPYRFDLRSKSFNPSLELFDSDGRLIASDVNGGGGGNAMMDVRPPRTGEYKLVIGPRTGKWLGDFILEVADLEAQPWMLANLPRNVEHKKVEEKKWVEEKKVEEKKFEPKKIIDENPFKEPRVVALAWNGKEHIQLDAQLTQDDGRQSMSGRRCRIYEVLLELGYDYEFVVRSDQIPPFLELTDQLGQRQMSVKTELGTQGRFDFRPAKTDFFKLIVGPHSGPEVGAFSLSVTARSNKIPPPVAKIDPPPAKKEIPAEARIEKLNWVEDRAAATSELNDRDGRWKGLGRRCRVYEIYFEKDRTYQIDLRSKAFDAFAKVLDDQDNFIDSDDDSGGDKNARIKLTALRSGFHKILVGPKGIGLDVGEFQLEVVRQAKPLALIPLALNDTGSTTAKGTLKFEIDEQEKKPCERYEVALEAGKQYEITLDSTAFDAHLKLQNAAGTLLASDDNSGGNGNARIKFRPNSSQKYRLVVSPAFKNETGAYTLRVETAERPTSVLYTEFAFDSKERGTASAVHASNYLLNGKRYTAFAANLEEGNQYYVELKSGEFSPRLSVQDDLGRILAEDESSDTLKTSTLLFKPARTGRYFMLGTQKSGNQQGSFTLSIRRSIALKAQPTQTIPSSGTLVIHSNRNEDDGLHPEKLVRTRVFPLQLKKNELYDLHLKDFTGDCCVDLRDAQDRWIRTDTVSWAAPKPVRIVTKDSGLVRIWVYPAQGNDANSQPNEFVITKGKAATAERIEFASGHMQIQTNLTEADGNFGGRFARHRAYDLRLEAGKAYRFAAESRMFRPALQVLDAKGYDVSPAAAEGGKFLSQLTFEPAETADYRVIVGASKQDGQGNVTFDASELKVDRTAAHYYIVNQGKLHVNPLTAKRQAWPQTDAVFFLFPIELKGRAKYEVEIGGMGTLVEVAAPDGTRIAADEAGVKLPNTKFTIDPPADGIYPFWVTTKSPASGVYVNVVGLVGPPLPKKGPPPTTEPNADQPIRLAFNEQKTARYQGVVGEADGAKRSTRLRTFAIRLEKNKAYAVNVLASTDFNVLAWAKNESGAFDVPVSSPPLARIAQIIPEETGDFEIGIYAKFARQMDYVLAVREMPRDLAPAAKSLPKDWNPFLPPDRFRNAKALQFDAQRRVVAKGSFEPNTKEKAVNRVDNYQIDLVKGRWYELSASTKEGIASISVFEATEQLPDSLMAYEGNPPAVRHFQAAATGKALLDIHGLPPNKKAEYEFTLQEHPTKPPGAKPPTEKQPPPTENIVVPKKTAEPALPKLPFDMDGRMVGEGVFELNAKGKVSGLPMYRRSISLKKGHWYEMSVDVTSGSGVLWIQGPDPNKPGQPQIHTNATNKKSGTLRFQADSSGDVMLGFGPHYLDVPVRFSFVLRDLGVNRPQD
jgi:hypothetical protein